MVYDPDFAADFIDKLGERSAGRPPVRAWMLVCAGNLIVPGFFGTMLTREGGRLGMVLGVLVVLWLGRRACRHAREAVLTVVYGGWVVAVLQIFPLLQVAAGFCGVGAAVQTGRAMRSDYTHIDDVFGGLLATLVTGGLLIVVAAVFGLIGRLAVRLCRWDGRGPAEAKAGRGGARSFFGRPQ
ncbi:hypothetical protein [Paludisphaera mucosa]|uniref:Uncharacterized protein n=1 Tax=Paludisphaera mucosa TaxID=3030827 RepID=A0ABT6FAH0_9BACT|nr:hypothetical protein [Paludisphaera mucosa]MDG3004559.1 hypothetical protein [Paludisphaera mucosa]